MKLSVIGAGYVGLVTAAGLARLGHEVRLGEADRARLALLENGQVPIFEDGLADLLDEARQSRRLTFHGSNVEAAQGVAPGLSVPADSARRPRPGRPELHRRGHRRTRSQRRTRNGLRRQVDGPSRDRGRIEKATRQSRQCGRRSSPIPSFCGKGAPFPTSSIPIGSSSEPSRPRTPLLVASLYEGLETQVVTTDPTSAEMIKYASNSYLATRLTFANTLANLCEAAGADILDVLAGVGLDHRIGPHFLKPGPGYGGSCFPKDTLALIGVAEDAGYDFKLLKAVIEADEEQRRRVAAKVRMAAGGGLRGRRIAMWGVAFKAGTDDVRESPATRIARLLIEEGAEVVSYDPEAHAPDIRHADSALEAVDGADVLLIATEWPEFATVDLTAVASRMRGHRIVDARNLLDPKAVRAAGLDYWGLGRPGA